MICNKTIFFALSIFLHFLLLMYQWNIEDQAIKVCGPKVIKVELVIKKQLSSKKMNKLSKKEKMKLLSQLGVGKVEQKKYFSGSFGSRLSLNDKRQINSVHTEIFERIDDRLGYPGEFIEHDIQGIVNVRLYFNSKGEYLENRTKFYTNKPYLKVYVARTLRFAFYKPIQIIGSRFYTVDTTFYFHLSTGEDQKNENYLSGNWLRFYRHAYGGDKIYDKIHKNAPKITNIIPFLWKHRPNFLKSEKTLVKEFYRKHKLETYQKDKAWDY